MPENLIDFDAYVKELEATCDPTKEADLLLLTCMDFRFFKEISRLMGNIKYDHVILAGAALGAVVEAKEDTWQPTFFDHLDLAICLHNIKGVLVMEHRECGAYGPPPGFGLLPAHPDPEEERLEHVKQIAKLRAMMPAGMIFASLLLDVPRGKPDEMTFDKLD